MYVLIVSDFINYMSLKSFEVNSDTSCGNKIFDMSYQLQTTTTKLKNLY